MAPTDQGPQDRRTCTSTLWNSCRQSRSQYLLTQQHVYNVVMYDNATRHAPVIPNWDITPAWVLWKRFYGCCKLIWAQNGAWKEDWQVSSAQVFSVMVPPLHIVPSHVFCSLPTDLAVNIVPWHASYCSAVDQILVRMFYIGEILGRTKEQSARNAKGHSQAQFACTEQAATHLCARVVVIDATPQLHRMATRQIRSFTWLCAQSVRTYPRLSTFPSPVGQPVTGIVRSAKAHVNSSDKRSVSIYNQYFVMV